MEENKSSKKFFKTKPDSLMAKKKIPFQSQIKKKNIKRMNKQGLQQKKKQTCRPLQSFHVSMENIKTKLPPKLLSLISSPTVNLSEESFKRGETSDNSSCELSSVHDDVSNEGSENLTDEGLVSKQNLPHKINDERDKEVNSSAKQTCSLSSTISLVDSALDQSDTLTQTNNSKFIDTYESLTNESLPDDSNKLFPIFSKNYMKSNTSKCEKIRSDSKSPPIKKRKMKDEGPHQMILDAGQKQFGATQCSECNMVYCPSDPLDKAAHKKFHLKYEEALKFSGWKKERVVQEYPEDSGRVLLMLPDDPKYMKKKLDDVNQIMSQDLGFLETNPFNAHSSKIFLYVRDKEICGCCVTEQVEKGYRVIPTNSDSNGHRPWRCNDVPEPVSVGISRLWVAADKRKSGLATKLVDCARQWFHYGTLIPRFKVAFSDPTPDGYKFASKYMGNSTFLVYKYKE